MTDAGWAACAECGMVCNAGEYHPYAACLMFKHCRNSETVRANLQAVRQQGRVEGLREASRKASDAVPLLLGTHPSFANVIADALMDFSDILSEDATKLAQQAAQDEKGAGDATNRAND